MFGQLWDEHKVATRCSYVGHDRGVGKGNVSHTVKPINPETRLPLKQSILKRTYFANYTPRTLFCVCVGGGGSWKNLAWSTSAHKRQNSQTAPAVECLHPHSTDQTKLSRRHMQDNSVAMITNSTAHGFWADYSRASDQEIPSLLCNTKVHFFVHKYQPLDPNLSQLKPPALARSHRLWYMSLLSSY